MSPPDVNVHVTPAGGAGTTIGGSRMNRTLMAGLVGVVGLALGFGAGWLWDSVAAATP